MEDKRQFKRMYSAVMGIICVAIHTAIFACLWQYYYMENIYRPFRERGNYYVIAEYVVFLFLFFRIYEGFKIGYLKMLDIVYSQIIAILCVDGITYLQLCLLSRKLISPLPVFGMLVVNIIWIIIWSFIAQKLHRKFFPPHTMIMVYSGESGASLLKKMSLRKDKYEIIETMSVHDEPIEAIMERMAGYESVILSDIPSMIRNKLLKFCFEQSIRVYITPKISDVIVRGADEIHLFDTPLLLSRNAGLTPEQRFSKRVLDLIISVIVFIITSPFMILTAIAIKLEDGGPVLYKQKRCTLNGREFDICKFRSMVTDAEKYGQAILASENDPRITKVGRFIRKVRIDELPQILNILFGDMSVVGPRPERPKFIKEYVKEMPEFNYRLKVKGGLTGYAQTMGKYNTTAYDKLKLDLMYIENYSILLDLKIILMTIKVLFQKESTEGVTENTLMTGGKKNSDENERKG